MYRLTSFVFFMVFVLGCSPKIKTQHPIPNFKHIPKVNFCDLPNHEGELVAIKAVYSGIDEYWALNAKEKCKAQINVELDYKEGMPIPEKYQPLFDSAYSSYWNSYLIIYASGIYESKNQNGYGHLGSNKARFIVEDYFKVELVRK